jgi:AcrR family transcriptional regulator
MEARATPARRNAAATKARIFAAAQQAFSDVGYAQAGIRHIAAIAEVDAALIQRYFGSKAGLYEAALIEAVPQFSGLDLAHHGFGSRLTDRFLEALLDMRAQSMIALSTSDPEAREISTRVMREHAVKPLAEWLGPPNAEARAIRMLMLTTSFMLYTRQIPLMTPQEAVRSATSAWLARALQEIIDER